jgi:guanylate kinase
VDGREYTFLSREEFRRRIDQDRYLEWAPYGDNLYGTPAEPVRRHLAAGRDVLLEIELRGAHQVRRRDKDAVMVFIAPPCLEVLEQRLRDRGTESEETIQTRMQIAREELAKLEQDGSREPPEFDCVIVNDVAEQASCRLRAFIETIRQRDSQR